MLKATLSLWLKGYLSLDVKKLCNDSSSLTQNNSRISTFFWLSNSSGNCSNVSNFGGICAVSPITTTCPNMSNAFFFPTKFRNFIKLAKIYLKV